MKGRIFGSLFALPFAGVGVWMLFSISTTLIDAWAMRDWSATEATLIDAGYDTHSGDDADTYEAYARYDYTWLGRTYTGDRVSISTGGDNLGDYQKDLGRQLSASQSRGETITVYVNPDEPYSSIVDRSIRWGLIGFKSVFVLVFGGVGFGLLYAMWSTPQEKDAALPQYQASPWLLNDQWQSATIRSSSKLAMWAAWGFAAFWNLISSFLPFIAYREVVHNQNYPALLALLFPAVGIGLLAWAVRRTFEWRRFGAAPVTLDPYPGAIGGHVGGTIDLNLPYDSNAVFKLTLTNVYSYESGSGDDRSQREKAKWQDSSVAYAEAGGRGTRLVFRFDVPQGLAESDAQKAGDNYHLWRLSLNADLPGVDLDRDYEIPVYATGATSAQLSDRSVAHAQDQMSGISEQIVRNMVRIGFGPSGKSLTYPMFRHLRFGVGGLFFGLVFGGIGAFLIMGEGRPVFGGVFFGVGALIGLGSLYMTLNSLEVSQAGASIHSVRRLLGIPISTRTMRRQAFTGFEKDSSMQSGSGNKHVMYYSVYALDDAGNKLTVGEGFRGAGEAEAAMRVIAAELGLEYSARPRNETPDSYGADVLTADR